MFDNPFKKRELIATCIFSTVIILGLIFFYSLNTATKIVFCDVGQGDATYIRIKNKIDILIDSGPNNKILACLGKYMPFYDRTIELAILTHHHKDHYGGFSYLIDRYQINLFINSRGNNTPSFQALLDKIIKKTKVQYLTAGHTLILLNNKLTFYWPTNEKQIHENDNSLIFLFENLSTNPKQVFKALFTGDASSTILNQIKLNNVFNIDILKIPHHGSKSGLSKKILQLAKPRVAVISVGKNNSFGHPNQEVLETLKALNIKIRRTDIDGDVIFKLD